MDLSLPVTIALIFLFTSLVVRRVQKTQERFVAA